MSRHYRELLEGHIVSETVYHRPPYTVAVVETEWARGYVAEPAHVTGCGVAKHSTRDIEAGLPWVRGRGETIALGRAYRDAYQVASALGLTDGSPQHPQCRCCAEPAVSSGAGTNSEYRSLGELIQAAHDQRTSGTMTVLRRPDRECKRRYSG